MKKTFMTLFLTNVYLFAEHIEVNHQMPWLIPWLIIFLILIAILFWLFYKAIKSQNVKYGYSIGFVIFLMIILLFF